MGFGKTILVITGLYGLYRLTKGGLDLAHFYEKLEYTVNGKIYTVRKGKLVVIASVLMNNPTDVELTIGKPTVRIYSSENGNRTLLGMSIPSSEKIRIKAHSSTDIPNIQLEIPLLSIGLVSIIKKAGVAALGKYAMMKLGQTPASGLGITVEIESIFSVNGLKDITKTDTISI